MTPMIVEHPLHNETNRDEVFDYVLTWIEDHIS